MVKEFLNSNTDFLTNDGQKNLIRFAPKIVGAGCF